MSSDPYRTRIDDLELGVRAMNALTVCEKMVMVSELLSRSEDALLSIPNFGRVSMGEIHRALAERGWYLGELPPFQAISDAMFVEQDYT
jgi:DNA-directed RNA polymerase alpha subunit